MNWFKMGTAIKWYMYPILFFIKAKTSTDIQENMVTVIKYKLFRGHIYVIKNTTTIKHEDLI